MTPMSHRRHLIFASLHLVVLAALVPGCDSSADLGKSPDALIPDSGLAPDKTTTSKSDQSCTPRSCTTDGTKWCGSIADLCGKTIECGGCVSPESCGGGGVPSQCGLSLCDNMTKDPTEADADCGGPCKKCSTGKACKAGSDCESSSCIESVCRVNSWSKLPNMPTPRGYLAAATGPDGRIYAIGGTSPQTGGLSKVEAYDPQKNAWTTVASMPTSRYGLCAATGSDGLIYAIGGEYDASKAPFTAGNSVVVEAYNPKNNTWTKMPSLTVGRYFCAAVTGSDGNIYVMGGFSVPPGKSLNTAESLKPGASSWQLVSGTMTTARSAHGAAVGLDGTIYVAGGDDSHGNQTNAFEYYAPGSGSWYTSTNMPTARRWLTASADSAGDVYFIGGQDFSASGVPATFLATVERYSPKSGKWVKAANMPTGRYYLAATLGLDARIYVVGGMIDQGPTATAGSNLEVYTP